MGYEFQGQGHISPKTLNLLDQKFINVATEAATFPRTDQLLTDITVQ